MASALSRDSNLHVIPPLDETTGVGFILSAPDVGAGQNTSGVNPGTTALPSVSSRRLVRWEGLSGSEEVHPTGAQTKIRRVLGYFHAGGMLRVYRNYPAVVSAWSVSNPEGYDDIVPAEHGSGAYPWFSAGDMLRHLFILEGITVAH